MVLACSVAFFIGGLLGFAPAQEEANAQSSTTEQPNIVFVLADDLDYASTQKMPEINSLLAEQGASFEEAFVSYPICCPARATILTGLYSHNHDVRGNKRPVGGFEKFRDEGLEEDTIAARLQKEGGYRTALIGKYLNGYGADDPTHVPPGWDEWYAKPGRFEYYDYELNENGGDRLLRERGRGLPHRRPLRARHRFHPTRGGRRRPLLGLHSPDIAPQSHNPRRAA